MKTDMDGVINVYKEKGFTSHDVVAKLRGICRQKKIGHTGTLDPQAEGVLPVCLGKATKLCDLLTDKDKEYEAVLRLGLTTDTQDVFGQTLCERPVECSEEEILHVMGRFTGELLQVPPMYSALKVNGKKLYELARAGREVERQARRITVYSLEIMELTLPLVRFTVHCSKGTYVRPLCHDIGEALGCGGCMESLLRKRVDRFSVEESLTLAQIEERMQQGTLQESLVPVEAMFSQYPARQIRERFRRMLQNGNALPLVALSGEEDETADAERILRVYDTDGTFVGLYQLTQAEELPYKPLKMFYGG